MSKSNKAEESRAEWGRHIEFILTLVGFAVGLGNVWRFPYLCYKNGGGAFLIPYIIFLVFIGIPIFGLEISFGQFGGKGPISIWSINPAFKGLGFASVAVSAIICIYYDVIIAWSLYYFFASMTDEVPWAKCDDCSCLLYDDALNKSQLAANNCSDFDGKVLSSSELYYNRDVLARSPTVYETGQIQWKIMLCNLLAWLIVFIVLSRGIKSLGKVVYFSSTFPYVLLTILLIRCAMLDGAIEGVKFYLTPRWEKLLEAEVWSDAAVQIFFSLSACQGGLVAMASYNKFSNNVLRDAFLVPIINCLTSFFAGFVVFSTLGFMAHLKHEPVANVTKGGSGLAFVVYPEALSQMPITPLWSILFFFMLCLLGFSSQFSIVETVMTSFIDEFRSLNTKRRRVMFRLGICLGGFLLGLPIVTQSGSYLLDLVDGYILGFPTLAVGLFECITVIWIYGYGNFATDVELMVGRKPFLYLKVCWVFISPLLLTAVIVFKAYQYKPSEDEVPFSTALGWLIVAFPIILIPVWFITHTCPRGVWQRLCELNSPEESWLKRRTRGGSIEDLEEMPPPYSVPIVNGTSGTQSSELHVHDNSGFQPDSPGGSGPVQLVYNNKHIELSDALDVMVNDHSKGDEVPTDGHAVVPVESSAPSVPSATEEELTRF